MASDTSAIHDSALPTQQAELGEQLHQLESNTRHIQTDTILSSPPASVVEGSATSTGAQISHSDDNNRSTGMLIGRKGRKRKRHNHNQHVNKNNKKWGKQFKRQMSQQQQQQPQQQQQQLTQQQYQQQQQQINNNKTDLENMPKNQNNNRNNNNNNNNRQQYGPKGLKSAFKNISHRNHRGGGGGGGCGGGGGGGVGIGGGVSKFFLPNDKRLRKELIIPPTKFLLGGNISDPLNLNSLQDEALNASMNAATPKSSPITTPPKIDVIIPPNIFDPLHLLDPVDCIEYEKLLISPQKRKIKHRNRKKKPRKKHESPVQNTSSTSLLSETGTLTADDTGELFINTDDEDRSIDEARPSAKKRDFNDVKKETFAADKERCSRDLRLDLSGELGICGRKRKSSECTTNTNKNKARRLDSMDKIVSPVIPQPGAWKRPPILLPMGAPRNRNRVSSTSISEDVVQLGAADENTMTSSASEPTAQLAVDVAPESVTDTASAGTSSGIPNEFVAGSEIKTAEPLISSTATKLPETSKYQYGNYNRYFGFNSLDEFTDVRLKIFKRHAFLFRDKDMLDIGCNVGHMTIAVARKLNPKSIMGIDIDKNLISRARHNISLYVKIPTATVQDDDQPQKKQHRMKSYHHKNRRDKQHNDDYYPISFPICYRGIPFVDATNATNENVPPTDAIKEANAIAGQQFPNNVYFRTMNYVVPDESMLSGDTQQYDLILCLSVSKWIHLNFGDVGLKMAFKRMFNQLRPGGKLILEAQNWASYKKKKKLTETIFNNYKNIEFYPNSFHEYLLSPEVGFSHSYALGIPRHMGKGFRRPIQLYVKGDFTPSQIRWSDNYHPQTPYEAYRGYYADMKRQHKYLKSFRGVVRSGGAITGNSSRGCGNSGRDTTPYRQSNGYYSQRQYTPAHGLSSTSQYYNPLETDSYLPSYDNEVQTRHYCFESPLYSTVWSPPTSGRKSASNTPLFGSIRRVNDSDDVYAGGARRHVYVGGYDGGASGRDSVRSLDESSRSPQMQHVYATASLGNNSAREVDGTMDSNSPKGHVYASASACENSSSPTQQYSGESTRSVEIEQEDEECLSEVKNGF